jgi:RNA polymerase sigma-70 factor (ECF subfamily)
MSENLSFEDLLLRVRQGDEGAAQELVRRYEPAIRRAVRFRLANSRLARLVDSMDICQSVLASFFVRAGAGQYDLHKPEQLFKLLVAMAHNKLATQDRAQRRQRRDYRRLQAGGLEQEQAVSREPSPSRQVVMQDLLQRAQRLLSAEEQQIAELRKEGLEWQAIAQRLGGTAEGLRKQLARAADRVAHELDLDEYCHE